MSGNSGGGGSNVWGRRLSVLPGLPHVSIPSTSTSSTQSEDEPRRRHGSAPSTTALAISRRGSVPVSMGGIGVERPMAPSSSSTSRRGSAIDLVHPRKISEPAAIVHKPTLPSPKRKPVPKGSAHEKSLSKDDEINQKLGKMDLNNGSTMVLYHRGITLMIDCGQVYVL